jgi:hypothetical protein
VAKTAKEKMSIKLKSTVNLYGVKPETTIVMMVVSSIFIEVTGKCLITSVKDSHETRVSLHNEGYAFDVRTNDLELEVKQRIEILCKEALPQCDVEIHDLESPNEHLHVEYDPKNNADFLAKKAAWKAGQAIIW